MNMDPTHQIQQMKQCLREAGVDDEGMTLQEIKQTFVAINSSRDVSVTVDSDDDNENVTIRARIPSQSGSGIKNTLDSADMQWQSKPKANTEKPESLFNYKVPKVDTAMAVTPLEALKDDNCTKEPTARPTQQQSRTVTLINNPKQTATENEFAALDNGNPGDLPRLKLHPVMERLCKRNTAEELDLNAGNPNWHVPPPYNDPRVRALPHEQRFAIIGKYMRDMQEYLLKLSRASPIKAPWGKPIASSPRFSGTLDKVPQCESSHSPIEEMEIQEQGEDSPMQMYTCVRPPMSPTEVFLQDPFQDIIEREPSGVDSDEVRTNTRTRRKRKATRDPIENLSDSDSSDTPEHINTSDIDPDFEDRKRRKTTSTSTTNKYRASTSDNPRPTTSTYDELVLNRPDIKLTKLTAGKGTAVRGRGRGRGARGGTNADIMGRSSLFKDSPLVVARAVSINRANATRAAPRNRRLMDLSHLEDQRKAQEAIDRARLEESISISITDIDDEPTPQLIDDENCFQKSDDSYKRRVPVPLPKARPGVPRMNRKGTQAESTAISNDDDVIELTGATSSRIAIRDEEQQCPLCSVMFKSSIIQDHAANCDGEMEPNTTITCFICDKVFMQNKDFEVHSSECISIERKKM